MRVVTFAVAFLLLSGCEKDASELSSTAPSETLPFPTQTGDAVAPPPPPPPLTTATVPSQTTTNVDDSGFDSDASATAKAVTTSDVPPAP